MTTGPISETDFLSIARELQTGEIAPPVEALGEKGTDIDPRGLLDRLQTKRNLISLLERGGYVQQSSATEIRAQIEVAIKDLEVILEETGR